jgi:ABC-type branched-subunit amino acid transport system ATPase component/ABC-type branched-subunit amino acid transport system permease subunit
VIAFLGNAPAVALLGVVTGLQYGLLGLGIVLVFKANRFVNFTHGQLGILAAAFLAKAVLVWDLPYWVAVPIALAFAGLTGAVVERIVVQRLFNASRLVLVLATIGVSQLLLVGTLKGPLHVDAGVLVQEGYPSPFNLTWRVGQIVLIGSQVLTLVVAPLLAIALALFFARTSTGKAIRAAASNPDAARLAGISVRRVSLIAWVAAGVLSGLTAILLAPSQPTIDVSALGPGLLFRGLAAALAGGLTSLPIAFGAGVALGVAEQTAFWNLPRSGVSDITVLVFVLVAVVIRRRALAGTARRGDDVVAAEPSRQPLPERLRTSLLAPNLGRFGWAALLIAAAVLPLLPGLATQEKAVLLTFMLCYALVALSLTLLTGWGGQVSLGHFALLGAGAYAAAKAGDGWGWGVPAVLMFAGLAAALLAMVIGIPALRFPGLVLAVTTLGVALAAPAWLFRQTWVSEGSTGNASYLDVHMPGIGDVATPRGKYYVALVVVLLALGALRSLRHSGVGRAIIAVRDDERTAAAHGITPAAVKVLALGLSGFLAGVAGGLWASVQGNFSFQSFSPAMSVTMLAAVIVGGLGTLHGPLLGTFAVWAWPYLVPDANTFVIRTLSSGTLLLVIVLIAPGGVAAILERGRVALLGRLAKRTPDRGPDPLLTETPLEVSEVGISFGGLRALGGVTLNVQRGEIVGLIGGNGAGKSTLMACVSGHLRPDAGQVHVFGRDVTDLAPEYRPYLGVARSFQDANLYPGLTVLETVLVAVDRTDRAGTIGSLSSAPWTRAGERRKQKVARAALARVGLADRADTKIGELSTGMRRLCDLGCVLATRPALVLLDEPTAGIAQREVEQFGALIRLLRDELGCAVLVIEHDMPLLMSLCDRIYALEQGRVIAEGTPDEVRADPRVIASYLGTDAAAIERSGGSTTAATTATKTKTTRRKPARSGR